MPAARTPFTLLWDGSLASMARRLHAVVAIALGEAQYALGLAQAEQGVDSQQFFDHAGAGRAHHGRLGPAPVGVAHEKADPFLGQVSIGPARAPALGLGRVGLHQLTVPE